MRAQGKITPRQYERANATALPEPEDIRLPGTEGPAPYFVNYVKDELVAKYGAGRVFGGGLKVRTTIDLDLQLKARAAIERILPNPDGPAAALVAIDPRSGAVKAMFGGRNFRDSQFNLAAQAKRQPGSAFKPLVLATAMNEGISPVDGARVEAGLDRRRRPRLEGDELRQDLPRPRQPVAGDGLVRQLRVRAADGSRRAEGDREDIARTRDPQPPRPLLLDRARLRRREPARDGARVRDARERGSACGWLGVRQPPARRRVRRALPLQSRGNERAHPEAGRRRRSCRAAHGHPRRRRALGYGKARRDRGPRGRGQDGHDGQLRRRLVRGLHARARRRRLGRLPGRSEADAHGVRRRGGRGRNVAGAHLEGIRGEGRRGGGARSTRRRTSVERRRGS